MSNRIAIRGIGPVGGFGTGREDLLAALDQLPGPNATVSVDTEAGAKDMPAYLADVSRLTDYVNKRKLRRIDKFSKMAVLGAALALEDAGLLDADHTRTGVVVATGYGAAGTTFAFLDSVMDDGDACASPTMFSNSVHSAAAANVTILLGLTGPGLTISQFEMSVPVGLWTARQWLLDGRVDRVLFGGIDEYCSVLGYARDCYFGVGNEGPLRPLAFDRQTAVVGEGACFLVLTRDDHSASGFVADIAIGHLDADVPPLADAVVFAGADGHRQCGKRYAATVGDKAVCACAPVYGSLPTGPAFDLAIAALALQNETLWDMPDVAAPALTEAIRCLKIAGDGEFGVVTVTGPA